MFDFVIPLSVPDLAKSGGINQYVVQDVASVQQLKSQVHSFRVALKSKGPRCILDSFDTPYSVLCHFQSVDPAVKEDTLELLIQAVSSLSSDLPAQLDDPNNTAQHRKELLNVVKMSCYLLSKLTEAFENETSRAGLITAPSKGNKKTKFRSVSGFDWDAEREQVLKVLVQLLQIDIRRLWNLSLVEEEFSSLITCCCYKLLENPFLNQAKNKGTKETILHLLGVLIKKYNHLVGASVKVVQLLQHFEHLAPVFAQAVSLWVTEYSAKSIVGEVMREIGLKSHEDLAHEGSGTRAYATFLTELASAVPATMIPAISVLLEYLDGESYVMRMAVLEVMGEMVAQVLNGEKLEDSSRDTRDQLLETLQEHIHDINSFVRSRVLQVYTNIVQKKALPLARFRDVLDLTIGRLADKSVNVCKNAIQLLAAFMANNPFTWKLSSADLREPLEKEICKLKEMKDKEKEKTPVAVIEAWEVWNAMEPELIQTVEAVLSVEGRGYNEDASEDHVLINETPQESAEKILHLLQNNKYRQAIVLTLACLETFPESEYFSLEKTNVEDKNTSQKNVLNIMGHIFKGSDTPNSGLQVSSLSSAPVKNLPGDQQSILSTESSPIDIDKQQMLVQYLRDTHNFAIKMEKAIAVISDMLYWKTTSVVLEAINFFVTVSEFGVSHALIGIRRMLPLVWSKDSGVKEAVIEAYRRLYLNPSGDTQRAKAQTLIHNLSLLMVDASLGTVQCLEEIIIEFFQKGEFHSSVTQLLWERFTGKIPSSSLERRAAVLLIGMASRVEQEIVYSNLDTLIAVALKENVQEDYLLARDVCITISKIADGGKQKTGKSTRPFRMSQDHPLFSTLSDAIVKGVTSRDSNWTSFSDHAISLIYLLSESPEKLCANILHRCAACILEDINKEKDVVSQDKQNVEEKALSPSISVLSFLLANLFCLVGAVAFQQMAHLETSVCTELQRRRMEKEEQTGATSTKKSKQPSSESNIDEEMGLVGATAEDTEAELVRKICENELLSEDQLLSKFTPLILKVCNSPGQYTDQLSTAACLALSKCMMISSEFCDSHLRLLFTLLEKSPIPSVRSNTIIALGDLTIRFPNLIEPWTPHLYARLRDESSSVRKTAVIVMTHLILKDLVKVKGQISEMAVLLNDGDPEITSLAYNFFNELASKDNAIYNLLPDMISRLSDPEKGVEEQLFKTIMTQLFSYITKDKQTESLVEKLCQRFRTARTERQCRDLAHCLTLLSYTERGLKKMLENFDCYGDKLVDDHIYQSFLNVIGQMRKGTKPEFKALVDEFEQKLTACHNRGMENIEPIELEPSQNKEEQGTKRGIKQRPILKNVADNSFVTPKHRASKKAAARKKKMAVTFSSDENSTEESDADAEIAEHETPKVTTPIGRSSRRTRAKK
uniref:Condensin complex subunit 1 n=1 Tax=Erpetoichthys calabaricus TaxID=27687 RepID=A0A8C4S641_ERPCA